MPSILIVEDHKLLAEVLTRALRDMGHLQVAGITESAEDALERLPGMNVDVILVDVSLPKMNGIELVSIIHEKYPHLPCLMLSGHTNDNYVNRALDAGARGYVVKEDIGGIIEGIQCVLDGGTFLSKQLSEER